MKSKKYQKECIYQTEIDSSTYKTKGAIKGEKWGKDKLEIWD